jgi:hypothetical protein
MSGKIVTVDFRSDTLVAVERDDGVFVALRPICEAVGVDWSAQLKRVKGDPVLAEAVAVIATPFGRHGQEETCLRLEFVNGWLMGIDSRRVREVARQRLIEYQRECHRVLFSHFYGKATGSVPQLDEPEESESVRLRMVTEARQTFGVRAGAELWFKLGLPIVPAMLHDPRQMTIDYSAIKPAEERPPDQEKTAA